MSIVKRLLAVEYVQYQQWQRFSGIPAVLQQKYSDKVLEQLKQRDEENENLYGPKLSKKQVIQLVRKRYVSNMLIGKSTEKIDHKESFKSTDKEYANNYSLNKDKIIARMNTLLNFPLFEDKLSLHNELADLPYNHYIDNTLKGYMPSVTKIISETMSEQSRLVLERWKANMIEKLGEEGFKKFQQETFDRGNRFHSCIEQYLQDMDVDVSASVEGYWTSLHDVLDDVTGVSLIEQKVTHPHLRYTGYFDCVAKFKDTICLIDWKTSKKQKATLRYTYDNPLQVAAYLGALNFDPNFKDLKKVENTMIVVAYEDGQPAHAHLLKREKCEYYWQEWLKRLHEFWAKKLDDQSA